ncbi:MAG: hypothetical protein MI976_01810 [Pseudomonadales bacterium]|nr:hypothetical protein [Pseudomonadales bacterium]
MKKYIALGIALVVLVGFVAVVSIISRIEKAEVIVGDQELALMKGEIGAIDQKIDFFLMEDRNFANAYYWSLIKKQAIKEILTKKYGVAATPIYEIARLRGLFVKENHDQFLEEFMEGLPEKYEISDLAELWKPMSMEEILAYSLINRKLVLTYKVMHCKHLVSKEVIQGCDPATFTLDNAGLSPLEYAVMTEDIIPVRMVYSAYKDTIHTINNGNISLALAQGIENPAIAKFISERFIN